MMNDYGHWNISLVGTFNPDDHVGFVYIVTNKISGKKYIGKKLFHSRKRLKIPKKNGIGTKIKILKFESDWKKYTTSSKLINEEISNGELFDFKILSVHNTKGALAYEEVRQIVLRDALRMKDINGNRLYYNGMIPAIRFTL